MKSSLQRYRYLLAAYFAPLWRLSAILTCLLLSGIALKLVNPQILKVFIDTAVSGGLRKSLVEQGIWFLGIAIVIQTIAVAENWLATNIGLLATNRLRSDLALHCLNLDMSFHKQHTPGEMIERVDGDVGTLGNFFSRFVVEILGSLILMAGILVMMFFIDWRVGLAFCIFCILMLVWFFRLKDIAIPRYRKARQASAELFGFLEEHLSSTEDVRANGATGYVMRRFSEQSRPVFYNWVGASLVGSATMGTTWVLFAIGSSISLALGAFLYQHGLTTIGTVYLIFRYAELLNQPLDNIIRQFADLQQAGASAIRVLDLLTLHSEIPDIGTNDLSTQQALDLSVEAVSFAYQKEESEQASRETTGSIPEGKALQGIDFRLPGGTILGLLGRTGSGKTTLTRLLVRFYDPQRGALRLGGIPIHDIPQATLRRRIGLVTQDVQLFNASLRDNLTLFDPSIPDSRIFSAFEQLGLMDWYNTLPEGLMTKLEPGGSRLSAGEAQLLAFVRVFLRDPGLVILDEASSRLDPATEARLDQAIERLLKGRTAIIIAHRLGTVQRADRILILENGRQIEYGEREQLARDPTSHFAGLLQVGLQEALV